MLFTALLTFFLTLAMLNPGFVHGEEQAIDEILVETERQQKEQIKITIRSEGLPAGVNVLTKEEIEMTPYTGNIADVLRSIPGVQVATFPGHTPPAIGMRGFRSWRASQTGIFIDGVPINQPQGATVGQADFAWLTPEMIERIDVIKGPFSALYGNFALSGVINITTKKSDPSPSLAGYGGTYATGRAVGVYSDPSLKVVPFLVWEGYKTTGYQYDSQSERGNLFNKFTIPVLEGLLSFRAHYYQDFSMDPGLINVDQVKSGLTRRYSRDSTGRNDNDQFDMVLTYDPKGGEEGFHGSMYYTHTRMDRTYPSTRPPMQYRNSFTDNYWGWKLLYDYRPFESLSLVVGNDLQYDQNNGITRTTINYFSPSTTNYITYRANVNQFGTGFFAQAQYKPFKFIKFVGGLRYDLFNIEVNNILNPSNSGTNKPSVFSPKIGMIITPYKDINIFVNRGQGFRTPYANEVSPANGVKDINLDVAIIDTYDAGFNALLYNRVYIGFTYYNTRLQREMLWDANTKTYLNIGTSKRTGLELEAKIFVTPEFTLYGNYSPVRARIANPATVGQYYITNQNPDSSIVGCEYNKTWEMKYRLGVNFYWLRYGRTPLNSTGTIIQPQLDSYLSKLMFGYQKWTVSLDTIFTPRRYNAEYMSLDTTGLWYAPAPTLQVMAGLRYQF